MCNHVLRPGPVVAMNLAEVGKSEAHFCQRLEFQVCIVAEELLMVEVPNRDFVLGLAQ